MSVGAIRYNATEAPENFSSRGPVTHYFKPVEGITPAEALGSPQILAKPDLVATDGGANTFFGACEASTWRFFGTSAAAPHAAAVAALERQAVPGATAEEVKKAQLETTTTVGVFPPTAVGAGLIDAAAAISKLKAEPFAPPTLEPPGPAPQNCELTEPEIPPVVEPEEQKKEANPPPKPPEPEEPKKLRPRTFFLQHPPKLIRTRHLTAKAVFRFGASESGVTFLCRVDGEPFRECRPRLGQRFAIGAHVVRAIARNAAGADPTPAIFRFRVRHVG
jgi:hypothetical protein